MKESIFNDDNNFFKSIELTEQGLLKARGKKDPIGTVRSGRKKIAEGKWIPTEKEKKIKVKYIDNSKGQYGFGNKIVEYTIGDKKIRVVNSPYSHAMKTGSALEGYISITVNNDILNSKEFKGKDKIKKAKNYLKKNFNIDYKEK